MTLKEKECNRSCYEIHAKFPSTSRKYEQDRNENISHAIKKVVKSHKISGGACQGLTKNINNALDDSFTKQFGRSFQESFQKCCKVEKKIGKPSVKLLGKLSLK